MKARVVGLALALVAGGLAWFVAGSDRLPLDPVVAWESEHPDTFGRERAGLQRFAETHGRTQRDDALALLLALTAGGLALGLWPAWGRRIGPAAAVLVAGAAALGLASAARSGQWLVDAGGRGAWTLGDDNLRAVAGPLTATLRQWREEIGPDDAVILAGAQGYLLNVVAWSLAPRPIHPIVLALPPELGADFVAAHAAALPFGAGAPARWLVDLDALAAGEATARPVLVRLPDP